MSNDAIKQLEEKIKIMEGVIAKLAKECDDTCNYCKHNIPCLGKECEFYEEGKGLYDSNDKYYDWKWSCIDLDFGSCDKLSDTPCYNCIYKDYAGFQWNGKSVNEIDN